VLAAGSNEATSYKGSLADEPLFILSFLTSIFLTSDAYVSSILILSLTPQNLMVSSSLQETKT
jgi:hypothetical protein